MGNRIDKLKDVEKGDEESEKLSQSTQNTKLIR